MIIHIVVDDKFLDIAWDIFEKKNPGRNIFVILGCKSKLKYIKRAPVVFFKNKRLLQYLKKYPLSPVILHWMDNRKIEFLNKLNKTQKIAWIGWGGDYYHLMSEFDILETKTKFLKESFLKSFVAKIRGIESDVRHSFYRNLLRKNLSKIDYFLPVIYEDYLLVKKNNPDLPPYLPWNYGAIEDFYSEEIPILGDSVLLGNSASINNNHIEAIDLIANLSSKNRIICPLSYGDYKVAEHISDYGKEKLESNFVPLREFIPLSDYLKILGETRFIVMNHVRQQGFGNVCFGLTTGRIVFMNSKSPLYRTLSELGIKLFSLEELSEIGSINDFKLSEKEKKSNREIMIKHYGRDALNTRTKNLLESILSKMS